MRREIPETREEAQPREGIALIEALLAIVILAGAVLSAGSYVTKLSRGGMDERIRAQALHLVAERFEVVKTAPTYGKVDSLYKGTETSISGYNGFTRVTDVSRVGGGAADTVDYKIVTVTVTTPAIPKSVVVKKSLIIADF